MTQGVEVTMAAKGSDAVVADINKVAQAVHGVAAAETKAAAAAHARGKAQHGANQHGANQPGQGHGAGYRTAHASGDHGGLFHGLHILGMAGGEVGHIGHRLGRAGMFGGAGFGAAGLGIAGGMLVEGLKEYNERLGEIVKESAAIGQKLSEARKSLGAQGLSYADSNTNALRRFGSEGGTFDELQEYQRKGLTANGLSKLRGLKNWRLAADSAVAARQFGSDPDSIAEEMAKHGGVRAGSDIIDNAGYYAGRQQGRRIDTSRRGYGRFGEGGYGGDLVSERVDEVDKFNNRGKVGAITQLENGAAANTALKNMTALLDPMGAVITKAFKEAVESSVVLKDVAAKQSSLLGLLETIWNPFKGDAGTQARQSEADKLDALQHVNRYAPTD